MFAHWRYELLEGALIVSANAPGLWHQAGSSSQIERAGQAGPSIQALQLSEGSYDVVAEAGAGEIFEVGEPVKLRFDPIVLLDE